MQGRFKFKSKQMQMIQVASIKSVHGVRGDLVIAHQITKKAALQLGDALLIELLPGSRIPFFIDQIRDTAEGEWLVHFEEIQSREEARDLLNKDCYIINTKNLPLAKTHNWKDVLGYLVMDQDEKPIGPIQDILSHGAIFLAEVSFEQKIVTIPLNENLVLNKNEEQKILKMEIPTGLLDL